MDPMTMMGLYGMNGGAGDGAGGAPGQITPMQLAMLMGPSMQAASSTDPVRTPMQGMSRIGNAALAVALMSKMQGGTNPITGGSPATGGTASQAKAIAAGAPSL